MLRQGLQFCVIVILARLLRPEDFGTYALLAFFTTFSVVFLQGGLSIALVQRQDTTRDEESAMFWWNVFASCFVGGVFVLAAPVIASYFHQPVLRQLSMIAALQLVLAAASETQIALLTREMQFHVLARAGMIATPLAGSLAVASALYGAGIWSLAIQGVTYAGASSLVIWFSIAWRPNFHFRFATIQRFFALGAWVSAGTALDLAFTSSINLLVGKLYSVRQLGFYDRASSLQTNLTSSLAAIVGRVTLPLFASRQNEPAVLRESARSAIGFAMLINVPLLTGMALLADLIIEVLFGAKWRPSAPIFAILALSGIAYPLHLINVHLAVVRNLTRTYALNELIKKSIGVLCVAAGAGFGITGVAWALLCYSVLSLIVYQSQSYRDIHYELTKQVRDILGIFFATVNMAGIVTLLRTFWEAPALISLIINASVGAAVYMVSGLLIASKPFVDALELFKRKLDT